MARGYHTNRYSQWQAYTQTGFSSACRHTSHQARRVPLHDIRLCFIVMFNSGCNVLVEHKFSDTDKAYMDLDTGTYKIQSGLHNYIIHGLLLVLSSDAFSWTRRTQCWTRTICSSVPHFRPQVSSCRSCKSPATEQNHAWTKSTNTNLIRCVRGIRYAIYQVLRKYNKGIWDFLNRI